MREYPQCSAISVIGSNHVRNLLPNQDACRFERITDEFWIAAIADGHGSSQHPRSHLGSRVAVDIAIEECKNYLMFHASLVPTHDSDECLACVQQIAKNICSSWVEAVNVHFEAHPLQHIVPQNGKLRETTGSEVLYGTTLTLAVAYEDFLYTLSIGDSEISLVLKDRLQVVLDIHGASRFAHEETYSVCLERAWLYSVIKVFPVAQIASVFLHTDGVSKSLEFSSDLAELFRYYHISSMGRMSRLQIESDMIQQLTDLTQNGSGDDCTMMHILLDRSSTF